MSSNKGIFLARTPSSFKMIKILSTVLLVATAAQSAIALTGYNVKFMQVGEIGVDGFISMFKTEKEAKNGGWVQPEESKSEEGLKTYCPPNDARTCSLYDGKGTIAGHQVSLNKTAVDNLAVEDMDYVRQGYEIKTLFNQLVYSIRQLFVPQEVIEKGGRDFNGVVLERLSLPIGDGNMFEVPISENDIVGTVFNKTNCFPKMGQHYFYGIGPKLSKEFFRPYFLLYDAGQLVGYGVIAMAGGSDPTDVWMEHVPLAALNIIATGAPDWIVDIANDVENGVITQHIYFTDRPYDIACPSRKNV